MERKKILIWGEAGVGKTTFCAKFCQDWALVVKENEGKGQELTEEQKSELEKLTEEQKSKLNNIGLLFYIVLRDIDEGAKNVKDIIISNLGLNRLNDSQLLGILESVNEQSKFVIVMDGFDEISDKDEHVQEVLNGPTYHNVDSITTCRPHATRGIVLNVDVEIRLMGFSEAQAKAFVEMFARIKYNEQNQIELFVEQTMSQIESSAELLEMSTNPSMLQLLCLLSWKTGKIGKDRTSVFKDYTCYLLMQYHIKLGKKVKSFSEKIYHNNLLHAGKVALMGLKQNQLQLVFSKNDAYEIGGDAIFDIGFLTQLPNSDTDSVKVQFTHKTLQEYLAAFYVVNNHTGEELQLLMEFCSTSQRLMGSQIILEFVSNMSTKMGKEIQKKIKDFVSTWDSDDKVDPKSRTSFLISMLKGNKKLTFPLPAVVDIDLRYYDHTPGLISKFLNIFKRSKSTLERFLNMDEKGVKHVSFILAEYKRLNVLTNTRIDYVEELTIDYCYTGSEEDNEDLCRVMKKLKPGLLSLTNCKRMLMDEATIDVILQHVHTLILEKCDLDNVHLLIILQKVKDATMKSLSICNCCIKIDKEIAEAVSRLPDHTQLDLSSNQVTDKSVCLTLFHKAATLKSLNIHNCMSNCGIEIDTEIAEAVSRLPVHTQLDLSGNQVTDKSVCLTLLHKAATMKSLNIHNCMSNCGLQIDKEIAEAVSKISDHTELDLSGNQVTDKSACITLIHKAATMKSLSLSNCGIEIDTEIAEAVSRLPDHTHLDLSGNQVRDKSACITLINEAATMKSLSICNCGIQIDTEIAEAVSRLPDDTQLDLSGNDITKMKPYLLSRILLYMTKQEEINIHRWGITVDVDIIRVLAKLSKLQTLVINKYFDIFINKLTSRAASELPHTVSSMPHLQILWLDDCNISNDVMVALTDSLYNHCPLLEDLSLSGNHLSSGVWEVVKHTQQMKSLRRLWIDGNPCVKEDKERDKIKTTLQRSNSGLYVILY